MNINVGDMPLRIAVYMRLSTDKPHQRFLYERTVEYYRTYIEQHKKWTLVKIYADEGDGDGLSENMCEFKKMIVDCKSGNIDVIFTKSLSHFANNPSTAVSKIIQLAELNPPVGVFFEKEGCFSLELNYKLALHILHLFLEDKRENEERPKVFSMKYDLMMKRGVQIDR